MSSVKIYNADQMVVGRLASKVAKAALMGEEIVIVNAEKAVITGNRESVIRAFKDKHKIKTSYNPKRGPFHHRRPDKLVRQVIRGMLPWPKPRGKQAFKRIKVFIGVPRKYEEKEKIVLESSRYDSLRRRYITVGDLSEELGWRNMEVV